MSSNLIARSMRVLFLAIATLPDVKDGSSEWSKSAMKMPSPRAILGKIFAATFGHYVGQVIPDNAAAQIGGAVVADELYKRALHPVVCLSGEVALGVTECVGTFLDKGFPPAKEFTPERLVSINRSISRSPGVLKYYM